MRHLMAKWVRIATVATGLACGLALVSMSEAGAAAMPPSPGHSSYSLSSRNDNGNDGQQSHDSLDRYHQYRHDDQNNPWWRWRADQNDPWWRWREDQLAALPKHQSEVSPARWNVSWNDTDYSWHRS